MEMAFRDGCHYEADDDYYDAGGSVDDAFGSLPLLITGTATDINVRLLLQPTVLVALLAFTSVTLSPNAAAPILLSPTYNYSL